MPVTKWPNFFALLNGDNVLTGLEMSKAYGSGSGGIRIRSALTEWTSSPLEKLNDAF